jgi:hypothetical protein
MPTGLFRATDGSVQAEYDGVPIPIPRSTYERNGYKRTPAPTGRETLGKESGSGEIRRRPDSVWQMRAASRLLCASNLRHVIVTDGCRLAVVPIYRNSAPGSPSDRALVFHVVLPIDAIS